MSVTSLAEKSKNLAGMRRGVYYFDIISQVSGIGIYQREKRKLHSFSFPVCCFALNIRGETMYHETSSFCKALFSQ